MGGRSLKQTFSREEYSLPVATNPINLGNSSLTNKSSKPKTASKHKWTLFIVLFVAIKFYSPMLIENYRKEIIQKIELNLPSHYKPDKIIFFNENLPMNRNG